MTLPRSCCSNPTQAVDPPSLFTLQRAKLAKTLLGRQKRPTRIDELRRERIKMTTKIVALTMASSLTMIVTLVMTPNTTTTSLTLTLPTSSLTLTVTLMTTMQLPTTKAQTRPLTAIAVTIATALMSLMSV